MLLGKLRVERAMKILIPIIKGWEIDKHIKKCGGSDNYVKYESCKMIITYKAYSNEIQSHSLASNTFPFINPSITAR